MDPLTKRGTLGEAYAALPAVDILNDICKGQHVAMRPLATVNLATC